MRSRKTGLRRLRPYVALIAVTALIVAAGVVVVVIAPRLGTSQPTVAGQLVVGAVVAHPPATFWAVGTHAVKIQNQSLSAQVNETPITYFRWGGGGDTANQSTGVSYSPNGTPSRGNGSDGAFVKFCEWRECHSIFSVPGEINDPGAAAVTVAYVENTLGYHPDYWSIGNEPQMWTHYGIAWTDWRWTDASTPSPQEYAVTVQRDIAAMRSVDPMIRVIGIQSEVGGEAGGPWLAPLVSLDGANLSAVAYHSYPGSLAPPGGSVANFLATAASHGFPSDYRTTEAEVAAACPRCHIPVFVDEYNGAIEGPYSPYVQSYPDVPLVAAAVAGGLKVNASQFSFFDLQATTGLPSFGLLGSDGTPRPTFELYSYLFRNLSMAQIDNTTILGGPSYAVAVVGSNATTVSLLVSNANTVDGLRLELNGSGFPLTESATAWSWGPSEPAPVVATFAAGAMPNSWFVPAEGVLLVDVPA